MAGRRLPRSQAVLLLGVGATVEAPPRAPVRPTAPKREETPQNICAAPGRVLGLDLALHTGWALLVGGRPSAHGTYELPDRPRRREGHAAFMLRRAREMERHIRLLLDMHRPDLVAYEYADVARPWYSGGTKGREYRAALALGRLEGALVLMWPRIGPGIPLAPVPMTVAKETAAGRVNATKDQVNYELRTRLLWDLTGWSHDEVDAGAVALAALERGIGEEL